MMIMNLKKYILATGLFVVLLSACTNQASQIPDRDFVVVNNSPAYKHGEGPLILVDGGHNNFHTIRGRFLTFANILREDGYRVKSLKGMISSEKLSTARILVIANALNDRNIDNWTLPTPSAFTKEEIEVLYTWVNNGGRLFLIADHMPWPGASSDLAAEFGFTFYNGFNIDVRSPSYFLRSNGTLADNIITNGKGESDYVRQIPKTEGQAFQIPDDAEPILIFDKTSLLLLPDTAWRFHENTPLIPIKDFVQGAYKKEGLGKIVVVGEASMFTAQINTRLNIKMGMNREDAKDNSKLLLNIIHWLDDLINEAPDPVSLLEESSYQRSPMISGSK